jgi:hypothetical protein
MNFKIIVLPKLHEKPLSAYTEYTPHSEDKRGEENEQGRKRYFRPFHQAYASNLLP